jgi:hypothetical protein
LNRRLSAPFGGTRPVGAETGSIVTGLPAAFAAFLELEPISMPTLSIVARLDIWL